MDPNATYKLIFQYIADNDPDGFGDAIDNLMTWVAKGGFVPDWTDIPEYWKLTVFDYPGIDTLRTPRIYRFDFQDFWAESPNIFIAFLRIGKKIFKKNVTA